MAKDPKAKIVGDRRRLLTIHDGARLTPALVAVLGALTDEVAELFDHEGNRAGAADARVRAGGYRRDHLDPVLVARSDGLAVYVSRDGELA